MNVKLFCTLLFFVWFSISFIGCGGNGNNAVEIEGEIPIDSVKEVKVLNYMTGKEILIDTIYGRTFELKIDSLVSGMYQVVFTWNRHFVTPQEIKIRNRYDIQEDSKFHLSKNIWVSKKGKRQFHIELPKHHNQEEIESLLMGRDYLIPVQANPSASESKIFEDFAQIIMRYYEKNLNQKDSLRDVMYALIETGDLETAGVINNRLKPLWLEGVKKEMEKEEVAYLVHYIEHPMIPYVLYGRISSKDDFHIYRPVYDALDPRIKEKIAHLFEGYIE